MTLDGLVVTITVTLAAEEERAASQLVVTRKAGTVSHVTSRQWTLESKATLVTALVHQGRIYSGTCCVCWTTDVHDNPEVVARPEPTSFRSFQQEEISILQLIANELDRELESVSITKDHATVLVELPVSDVRCEHHDPGAILLLVLQEFLRMLGIASIPASVPRRHEYRVAIRYVHTERPTRGHRGRGQSRAFLIE